MYQELNKNKDLKYYIINMLKNPFILLEENGKLLNNKYFF